MKTTLFLITILFASCSITRVATIDNDNWLVVIDKHQNTYEVKDINNGRFASFDCYDKLSINDTVKVERLTNGSCANFVNPVVKVINIK